MSDRPAATYRPPTAVVEGTVSQPLVADLRRLIDEYGYAGVLDTLTQLAPPRTTTLVDPGVGHVEQWGTAAGHAAYYRIEGNVEHWYCPSCTWHLVRTDPVEPWHVESPTQPTKEP